MKINMHILNRKDQLNCSLKISKLHKHVFKIFLKELTSIWKRDHAWEAKIACAVWTIVIFTIGAKVS